MHICNWKQFWTKISVGFDLRGQLGMDFLTGRRVMTFWIMNFLWWTIPRSQNCAKKCKTFSGINPSSVPFRVNTQKRFAQFCDLWVINDISLLGIFGWVRISFVFIPFCIFWIYASYIIGLYWTFGRVFGATTFSIIWWTIQKKSSSFTVSVSFTISAIKQLSSVFMYLLTSNLDRLKRRNEPEKISTSKKAEPQSAPTHYVIIMDRW